MQVDVPLKEAHIKAERLGDDATFLLTMEVPIRDLDALSIQYTSKNPIPTFALKMCTFLYFRSSESVSHKPKRLPTRKTPKPGSTLAKFSSDWRKTCFPNCRGRVCFVLEYQDSSFLFLSCLQAEFHTPMQYLC